jgi:hypothetical protein
MVSARAFLLMNEEINPSALKLEDSDEDGAGGDENDTSESPGTTMPKTPALKRPRDRELSRYLHGCWLTSSSFRNGNAAYTK